jgi:hypothetical protein
MKISKRDFKFFALGLFSFFLIESLYDCRNSVNSFRKGFRDSFDSAKIK